MPGCRDVEDAGCAEDAGDTGARSFFARVRVLGKVLVRKPASACRRRRPDRPGKIARPFYLALYVDGTGSNGARRPFSHALVGEMTNTFLKARTRRSSDHRAAPARIRRPFDHPRHPPRHAFAARLTTARPRPTAPARTRRPFDHPAVPDPHGRPARAPTPRGRPRAGARLCARARRSRRAGRSGRRPSACRVPLT